MTLWMHRRLSPWCWLTFLISCFQKKEPVGDDDTLPAEVEQNLDGITAEVIQVGQLSQLSIPEKTYKFFDGHIQGNECSPKIFSPQAPLKTDNMLVSMKMAAILVSDLLPTSSLCLH